MISKTEYLSIDHLHYYVANGVKILAFYGGRFNLYEMTIWNMQDCIDNQYKPVLKPLYEFNDQKLIKANFEFKIDYIGFRTHAYERAPLYLIEYLCKHRFDAFGLIEKGLAIDVQDLTKYL